MLFLNQWFIFIDQTNYYNKFPEIGFTPTNTIVHAGPPSEKFIKENESVKNKQQHKANTTTEFSFRQTASLPMTSSTDNNKDKIRTFADLSPSKTAPDLQFIALSYKVFYF